jgi:hypothetical protein
MAPRPATAVRTIPCDSAGAAILIAGGGERRGAIRSASSVILRGVRREAPADLPLRRRADCPGSRKPRSIAEKYGFFPSCRCGAAPGIAAVATVARSNRHFIQAARRRRANKLPMIAVERRGSGSYRAVPVLSRNSIRLRGGKRRRAVAKAWSSNNLSAKWN